VKDLPYFTELPYEIGPGGEEGLIGQDTLADPFLRGVAQQTLSTNDTINIDGPFAVQACHTSDTCPIAVQNAFIARLPIIMPGHNMSINGSTYPTWGFASELINGDALVERAFADYKLHGSQYRLIKIKDGEVSPIFSGIFRS